MLAEARGDHASDNAVANHVAGRLGLLATLAEYERELIVGRVNAGIAAARQLIRVSDPR